MKKFIVILLTLSFITSCLASVSRTTEGLTEAEELGITAGLALACNAGGRLDSFELIASRLIANKAQTQAEENKGYHQFAESKLNAYMEQKHNPQVPCGAVLESFNNLPIFKSKVYANGALEMYDGTYLKPLRPVKKAEKQKPKKQQKNKKK